ncbi:OmpA family protein [Kangsaoukella pontilimi]|uniref:OmpA family protein n=1 Tax=Kangsaoukella pontilimi TaxID=2691042 RepID=UPI0029C9D120|nr:OmpA family protein [Kangsaoukella pontilimi]
MTGRAPLLTAAALAALLALPAQALDLTLPGAQITATDETPAGSVRLPDRPWSEDVAPPQAEGAITRTVYRSPQGTRTTLQLLTPFREQLEAEGYETVFTCADRACGGFDFRFQLDLIGEPDMHVDLGDYRYLLMRRDGPAPQTVAVVTSRATNNGYAQVITVGPARAADAGPLPATESGPIATAPAVDIADEGALASALTTRGHVILSDLAFPSGSATLPPLGVASLDALALWMTRNAGARVALVGHTDSVGNADANRALSRARAEAVRERLISVYGIAPGRIEADGVGYLSPIAPNTSDEGRARNRRVEAVLLTLE